MRTTWRSPPDGRVWLAGERYGEGRISVFDGHNWQILAPAALAGRSANALAFGAGDDVWVGTQQGLVLYETGSQTWTPVATCGSAAPRINALAFDAATGDLWIGIVVESSGQTSAIRLGPGGCESWTPSDGPYGVVDSIALDPARQDVWYGTSNGAYRWRMGSGWTQYWTQPGGLLHEHVWATSVGPDGDIWLGTTLG